MTMTIKLDPELGEDLFGRHRGPGDLSTRRKEAFADVVAERRAGCGR